MGIKKYKPNTPGQRGMTVSTFEEITTSKPEKSLTVTLKKNAGRNGRRKSMTSAISRQKSQRLF